MRKLLMALLAVVIVFAIMDIAAAQGKGGGGSNPGGGGNQPGKRPGGGGGNQPGQQPGGGGGSNPGGGGNQPGQEPGGGGSDPGGGGNQPGGRPGGGHKPDGPKGIGGGNNAVNPNVVRAVRMLRKLICQIREMINKKAEPEEIEKVEEKARKIIEWLKKHDIDWKELSKRKKCDLDPGLRKLIQALEWCLNELKGLDPEKDKRKIAKIRRKIHRIMKALRKMHVWEKDLPEGLCPKHDDPKGDGPKGDGPRGDGPKGDGPKHDDPDDGQDEGDK